jgi:hypothetical protein
VSTSVRVYVNSRALDLPQGATVGDAIRAWDSSQVDAVSRGERAVTDSRGLPASMSDVVSQGSILRVVGSRAS